MAPTTILRELAEPLVASAGLDLWDVEVGSGVVRILVDRAGGVDLDGLAAVSRSLSSLFDERADLGPEGAYQLEISSPGLERTLRTPDHYRRYLGAEVTVKTTVAVGGSRRHRGTLADATAHACTLDPADGAGPAVTIAYDQIERTRTVFEWGPAPKPGARNRPARPRSATSRAGTPPQPKDLSQ